MESSSIDVDLFQCNICVETFYKPKTLHPCLHRFCSGCVAQWFSENTGCPMCHKHPSALACDPVFNRMLDLYLTLNPGNRRDPSSIADQHALEAKHSINVDMTMQHINDQHRVDERQKQSLIATQMASIDYDLFQCNICLETVYKPKTLQPCMHRFCSGCIAQWFSENTGCPMCQEIPSALASDHVFNRMLDFYLAANPGNHRSSNSIADQQSLEAKHSINLKSSREESRLRREIGMIDVRIEENELTMGNLRMTMQHMNDQHHVDERRKQSLIATQGGQLARQGQEMSQLRDTVSNQAMRIDQQSAEVARLSAAVRAEQHARIFAETQVQSAIEARLDAEKRMKEIEDERNLFGHVHSNPQWRL